ncbi:bifunctional glycosyltransferase family 2/GtrA family protein [uncultured Cellulomonas sp.]|uniref:bifunctional glycosyltransferase family 2/GtrA family protein n=1 Tax=uncultured Cellulomonas sp. TaxID=189682 RepID=UPI0028EC9648|nr:bifunctional glycosyltransferase family 2/GtrA family protein [uncultured Cellulomonas sp.]
MYVLVPAYEPDDRLVSLVAALRCADLEVLVVDDGSGPRYAPTFDEVRVLGATVLGHGTNRGKGHALKAGFAWLAEHRPGSDVVCADCDGQHLVPDVLRVAQRLAQADGAMVLGARRFTGRVPLRSRWGNAVTGVLVRGATGLSVHDTQTGLRGYPASMLAWLQGVHGERFEYELELLLRASQEGIPVEEVAIETVYLDHNSSSHFRPLVDSARVVAPLLRFSVSSLAAFLVDTGTLLVLVALTGALLPSVVAARVLSSTVNFTVNRRLVFAGARATSLRAAAARYGVLAATMLAANLGVLSALTTLGMALLPAKVLTEVALFVAGYQLQRTVVFAAPTADRVAPDRRTGSAVGSGSSRSAAP